MESNHSNSDQLYEGNPSDAYIVSENGKIVGCFFGRPEEIYLFLQAKDTLTFEPIKLQLVPPASVNQRFLRMIHDGILFLKGI